MQPWPGPWTGILCAWLAVVAGEATGAPAELPPGARERSEIDDLRRQLAERDREISALREELRRLREAVAVPEPAATASENAGTPALPASVPEPSPAFADLDGTWELPAATPGPPRLPLESPRLDNLELFLGLDGSKQPQDFGVNAHFGGRFAANYAFPLVERLGIGAQVGTALVQARNAVQVFERLGASTDRFQVFTTVGAFQRTEFGLNWAIAYDFLYEQYFDTFHLGQWRGRFGYQITPRDEIGARVMLTGRRDHGYFQAVPVVLEPITMGTFFWQHTFGERARVTGWFGLADGHGQANLVLGDQPILKQPFVFGAEVDIPLSERISLFGQANFIRPADTGTVDAFLGFNFYPVPLSRRARSARFAPALAVAGNPTFAVDLTRGVRR